MIEKIRESTSPCIHGANLKIGNRLDRLNAGILKTTEWQRDFEHLFKMLGGKPEEFTMIKTLQKNYKRDIGMIYWPLQF